MDTSLIIGSNTVHVHQDHIVINQHKVIISEIRETEIHGANGFLIRIISSLCSWSINHLKLLYYIGILFELIDMMTNEGITVLGIGTVLAKLLISVLFVSSLYVLLLSILLGAVAMTQHRLTIRLDHRSLSLKCRVFDWTAIKDIFWRRKHISDVSFATLSPLFEIEDILKKSQMSQKSGESKVR